MSLFADYVACVRAAGTTANGVFSSKLMWAYVDELLARLRELGAAPTDASVIERHFPASQYVWLRRGDFTAQAVSWAKAIQSGRWHHWDTLDSGAAVYDRDQIDALAREAERHDAAWRAWFTANGIEPFTVLFEELVSDTVGVTREVLAFLGIATDGVEIAERTVSSHDGVNAEWLARYRSERQER